MGSGKEKARLLRDFFGGQTVNDSGDYFFSILFLQVEKRGFFVMWFVVGLTAVVCKRRLGF